MFKIFDTKAREQRAVAINKITYNVAQCTTHEKRNYTFGLIHMALFLGLITDEENDKYENLAYNRLQAALKEKEEQKAALKAERAAKAKAAKEGK